MTPMPGRTTKNPRWREEKEALDHQDDELDLSDPTARIYGLEPYEWHYIQQLRGNQ